MNRPILHNRDFSQPDISALTRAVMATGLAKFDRTTTPAAVALIRARILELRRLAEQTGELPVPDEDPSKHGD